MFGIGKDEPEDPTKPKEEGGKLEEEFDEICYLAVQSNFFSNWYRNDNPNKRTDRFPAVYMATDLTNPTSINSSITATLMNKIALQDFVYAKPALFSLLYPKLELYRIDYEAGKQEATERLFLIPHEANELYNSFDNVNTKVAGAGIKNLNWTLAGSNPAAAEKLIDLELNLEFANSYELSPNTLDEILINYIGGKGFPFNETDTDNTTINFLSLILHPQGKRNEYNGKFYRIKAKLGWQRVDSEILQQIGYDAAVAEALSAALSTQSMTLILNLISHSFELTEEGSISLQAKYQASLEQATDADIFDLFYRHSLKKQRLDSPGSTLDQLRQEKEALQSAITDDCITLTEDEKTALKELVLVEKDKEIQEAIEQQEDTLKQLEIEAKQSLTRHLSATESITTASDWVSGILLGGVVVGALGVVAAPVAGVSTVVGGVAGTVVGGAGAAGAVQGTTGTGTNSNNSLTIYSVTVSDKDVENYINYIKEINSGNKSATLDPPSLKSNAVQVGVNRDDAADITQQRTEVDAQSTSTTDTVIAKAETALQGVVEGIAKFGEFLYDFGSNDRIISFIYLYDLLTTFYNVLVEHINTEYQQDGVKRSELLTELKRFKVVLGDYQDRDTGDIVNIGEIPIHLQTFNEWYTNNIAKPNRVNYTFRDFVYSMVNDIVAKSLGASCVTGADLEKKISLGFSTYSLQHNVGNEPCEVSELTTNNTPTGYINFGVKNIKDLYTNSIIPTSNNVKGIENTNYLYVYAKQLPCELKGNIFEDIDKGIYHFFIGQTEGIQKSIKFKRIDQPYLKEARATKEDSFVLGQLREVYNADIVMVGNTIFHPGMIIYIHPPIEMGVTSNENTFSYLLGIGGYYSVIKVQSSLSLEGFETTLECVYLTSPNCKEPCVDVPNKSPEQKLQSELAKLKLIKTLNSSILRSNSELQAGLVLNNLDPTTYTKLNEDLQKKVKAYNSLLSQAAADSIPIQVPVLDPTTGQTTQTRVTSISTESTKQTGVGRLVKDLKGNDVLLLGQDLITLQGIESQIGNEIARKQQDLEKARLQIN